MKKNLIIIAALLAAVIIALQLFLAYGLTDSLRKWILPMAKERWNLDATVESVSVNLLGGSLSLNGVQIINPPGFDEANILTMKRFKLKIGLLALFRGGIAEIKKAVIQDATLNVVRSREGAINIGPIIASFQTAASNAPAPAPTKPAPRSPSDATPGAHKIPDFVIRQMETKTRVEYVDHQLSEPPFRLSLTLETRLKDIANYGRDDLMSGTINVQGQVLSGERPCAFDLNGRIAPIKDPEQLSFDLSGSIQTIDLAHFQALAKRGGFEKGQVSGTMTLYCQQGVFDPEKSILHLTFSQVKLTSERQERFRGIPFPETFKALVPVKGTLSNPQIDVWEAFLKTLASKDAFDAIIQGVLEAQGRSRSATNSPAAAKAMAGRPATDKAQQTQRPDIKKTLGGLFGKPENKSP
ncbi:MAG: AsmA family protein [Lentisphaerae bacterium]|nr:AsmA family protein [Lentisphaerota bacterium]